MKILKSDLEQAARKGILQPEQVGKLWDHLENLRPEQGKFQGLHVLYYFGGLLILASMSWFLTNVWDNGYQIMVVSGLFALAYFYFGRKLWNEGEFKIPGGLLITAAVGLTPVFIFGFETAAGLWPKNELGGYHDYHVWIKGHWIYMELGTIAVAALALRYFAFTFLTFPLAFTLWYMSMDLAPLIYGKSELSFDERKVVSIFFGFFVLIGSYFVDRKYKKTDFAFWTYLYGMMAFWGGLTMMESDSELNKAIYCALNIGFIVTSVYLRRKVFLVFGSFGVMAYLSHLAWKVFEHSMMFPLVLAALGIFIVYLGIKYQKNRHRFEALVEKNLPTFLMKWRPAERA
jgi:hypothetical protein